MNINHKSHSEYHTMGAIFSIQILIAGPKSPQCRTRRVMQRTSAIRTNSKLKLQVISARSGHLSRMQRMSATDPSEILRKE